MRGVYTGHGLKKKGGGVGGVHRSLNRYWGAWAEGVLHRQIAFSYYTVRETQPPWVLGVECT